MLQRQGLCHEAQSLARGLFELRLSFESFVEQLQLDTGAACRRVLDTVMLEKIKQAVIARRSSRGTTSSLVLQRQKSSTTLKGISQRGTHRCEELQKLKKHGFTGMNVEHRAKRSGLSDEYNIVYRNFSRNVHSTDFTELLLQEDPGLISTNRDAHLEKRNAVCCEAAFTSVAAISAKMNDLAQLSLDRRFLALMMARQRMIRPTSTK